MAKKIAKKLIVSKGGVVNISVGTPTEQAGTCPHVDEKLVEDWLRSQIRLSNNADRTMRSLNKEFSKVMDMALKELE